MRKRPSFRCWVTKNKHWIKQTCELSSRASRALNIWTYNLCVPCRNVTELAGPISGGAHWGLERASRACWFAHDRWGPGHSTAVPGLDPPTPGRAQWSPLAPKAQDTGWARQMLLTAPKTLCSGKETRTARQPTRKDLRTDLTKGHTELKYRKKERKRRAIRRQPQRGAHPGWAMSGGTQRGGRELGGGREGAAGSRRVCSTGACSCLLWSQRRGLGFYSESGGKPSVTEETSGSRYKKGRRCGHRGGSREQAVTKVTCC